MTYKLHKISKKVILDRNVDEIVVEYFETFYHESLFFNTHHVFDYVE